MENQKPFGNAQEKARVYAFIDSQNLNLGVRNDLRTKDGKHFRYKGWNLDFAKFYAYLRDKMLVEKAFIFIGFIADNQELYDSLTNIGYQMVYKPLLEVANKETSEVKVKGNIDAELVLHAMINLPKYDKAIIVSGDSDFQCLIEYLANEKKLAKIIIPNTWTYSSLLEPWKEYFFNINDLKKQLRYVHKKKVKGEEKVRLDSGSKPGMTEIKNSVDTKRVVTFTEKRVEIFPRKQEPVVKQEERRVKFH